MKEDLKVIFCSTWDMAMIARPPPLLARGKDLVAYAERMRSAIFASSPTPFNQVLTIKKTLIWWSNIKLLILHRFTEVPIERALNKDNLREWLENRDSKREDRVGTVIRLALLSLLLTLRVDEFGKRDEIKTWIGLKLILICQRFVHTENNILLSEFPYIMCWNKCDYNIY